MLLIAAGKIGRNGAPGWLMPWPRLRSIAMCSCGEILFSRGSSPQAEAEACDEHLKTKA